MNKISKREKAFEIYKKSKGKIKNSEIANILGVKVTTVETWKSRNKWKLRYNKVGAPYGNKNAKGNKGGAPRGNQNARVHGLNTRKLKHNHDIYESLKDMDLMEILLQNILILEANMIYSQKVLFVKDKNDHTKEIVKKTKYTTEYKIQFAQDKQIKALNALNNVSKTLSKMIINYIKLSNTHWDLIEEEHKLKVELLRKELQIITNTLNKKKDKNQEIDIEDVMTTILPNVTFLNEYKKLKKDKRSDDEFIKYYANKLAVGE
ncbi:phage terminase small subunit [uncultured Clostridium sp.]|uniref:phage terminase small subunit n=1 Tax=uncultured Clostridium sp. TaxID=59620 RepID=UPI002587C2AF|nr:phage terminase small subunit [uncultured Clostridium sp.]